MLFTSLPNADTAYVAQMTHRMRRIPCASLLRTFVAIVMVSLGCSACIDVDDFGLYWDKRDVDRNLAGTWYHHAPADSGPDQLRFSKRRDVYVLQAYNKDGLPKDNDDRSLVKTLRVGTVSYLMIRSESGPKGMILPYRIAGGRLEFIALQPADTALEEASRPATVEFGEWGGVRISRFDDDVFRWLQRFAADTRKPPLEVFARRP